MLTAIEDGDSGPNGTLPLANIVFTNPLDDRVMQVVSEDGAGVYLSRGEKSSNGSATSLTHLEFNNLTSGTSTVVSYSRAGLPAEATHDGRHFSFQWGEGTLAILADLGTEAGTLLTTVALPQSQDTSNETAAADSRRMEESFSDSTVEVSLTGCAGDPATAESVTIDVWTDINDEGGYDDHKGFPVTVSADGVYRQRLPVTASPVGSVLSDVCETVKIGRDAMCKVTANFGSLLQAEAICVQLSAYVARVWVLAAPVAFAACNAILGAAYGYCHIVGYFGLAPPGSPSMDSILFDNCPKIEGYVDRILGDSPSRVGVRVNGALMASRDFPGQPGNWAVSLTVPPELARLLSFVTDPIDPSPKQEYFATATLDCLAAGDEVQLSIVGTDAYTGSKRCSFIAATTGGSCALSVPGADAEVVDTLTISQKVGFVWTDLATITIVF